jgi:hypothetical protein
MINHTLDSLKLQLEHNQVEVKGYVSAKFMMKEKLILNQKFNRKAIFLSSNEGFHEKIKKIIQNCK